MACRHQAWRHRRHRSVVTAGVPRFPGACHQIKDRAGRPRRLFTQGHYHGVVTISLSGHEHDLTASAPPREIASKGGLTDTCIRTVSLRTGVSVSGKRNFVRRDKGNETSREVHREPRQRRSSRHNSADSAAITAWPGNLLGSRNACWAVQDKTGHWSFTVPAPITGYQAGVLRRIRNTRKPIGR